MVFMEYNGNLGGATGGINNLFARFGIGIAIGIVAGLILGFASKLFTFIGNENLR